MRALREDAKDLVGKVVFELARRSSVGRVVEDHGLQGTSNYCRVVTVELAEKNRPKRCRMLASELGDFDELIALKVQQLNTHDLMYRKLTRELIELQAQRPKVKTEID